jgi:hypothetical protein
MSVACVHVTSKLCGRGPLRPLSATEERGQCPSYFRKLRLFVTCPAAAGKLRCSLRPASMTLDRSRPEILTPPPCCTQQTLTIGPGFAAKTRQKHDHPSAAHRRSYARRTSAD